MRHMCTLHALETGFQAWVGRGLGRDGVRYLEKAWGYPSPPPSAVAETSPAPRNVAAAGASPSSFRFLDERANVPGLAPLTMPWAGAGTGRGAGAVAVDDGAAWVAQVTRRVRGACGGGERVRRTGLALGLGTGLGDAPTPRDFKC